MHKILSRELCLTLSSFQCSIFSNKVLSKSVMRKAAITIQRCDYSNFICFHFDVVVLQVNNYQQSLRNSDAF